MPPMVVSHRRHSPFRPDRSVATGGHPDHPPTKLHRRRSINFIGALSSALSRSTCPSCAFRIPARIRRRRGVDAMMLVLSATLGIVLLRPFACITGCKTAMRPPFPRVVGYVYTSELPDKNAHGSFEPVIEGQPRKKRDIAVSSRAAKMQKELKNSERYDYRMRDPLYDGDCVPMHSWQETSFPTCNTLHELDFRSGAAVKNFGKLNEGGYNEIFWMADTHGREKVVIKILEYGTSYSDRNFDRVRRDALIMERLTRSKYVLDIHAYCGFAMLVPFSKEGVLENEIYDPKEPLPPERKLKLATEAALSLADAHNIDGDGMPSISHGDLSERQFLMVDGVYKLSDFNRGRFLRLDQKTKEPCTYTIEKNDAKFRAPEEYKYEPETSKIDVWALGSIFHTILTGLDVWDGYNELKAQQYITDGRRPPISSDILNSTNPIDKILLRAIDMCYVYDPEERPTATVVANFLTEESKRLG